MLSKCVHCQKEDETILIKNLHANFRVCKKCNDEYIVKTAEEGIPIEDFIHFLIKCNDNIKTQMKG